MYRCLVNAYIVLIPCRFLMLIPFVFSMVAGHAGWYIRVEGVGIITLAVMVTSLFIKKLSLKDREHGSVSR